MTETIESTSKPKSGGGLSAKLLPELKTIASGLGIKTGGMKKADLVAAIKSAQGGGAARSEAKSGGSSSAPKSGQQERGERPARSERPATEGTSPGEAYTRPSVARCTAYPAADTATVASTAPAAAAHAIVFSHFFITVPSYPDPATGN